MDGLLGGGGQGPTPPAPHFSLLVNPPLPAPPPHPTLSHSNPPRPTPYPAPPHPDETRRMRKNRKMTAHAHPTTIHSLCYLSMFSRSSKRVAVFTTLSQLEQSQHSPFGKMEKSLGNENGQVPFAFGILEAAYISFQGACL